MKNTDKLRKALDTIALKHAEGVVSNDLLIKACENYKNAIGFNDDFAYQMIVAKTCFDYINGVEQDANLIKAVLPGQTKVIDQIMYVYSATAPGSKKPYDWHIVGTTQTGGVQVGRAVTDVKKKAAKQAYINDLFPTDTSSLKQIKALGGSTGAVLVEDVSGNKYVKKTSGTGLLTIAMVKNEYLANQVYDLLGVRVPDYELYQEPNGEMSLVSRFISGFTPINKHSGLKERKLLAQHAIADVLLNNWDVFCNDNSNLDVAGRVVRVDNGATFNFRAQGGLKFYDTDVLQTYKNMAKFNSSIFDLLDIDDVERQVNEITAKKDQVVAYLKAAGGGVLAKTTGERIDNLKKIVNYLKSQQPAPINVAPRKLMPAAQMYRKFTDDEIQKFWDDAEGSNYVDKIDKINPTEGWALLSKVIKARGFDGRPRVVDEKEYWDIVSKSKHPQMFRGVSNDWNNSTITADYQKKHFKYNDSFYVGKIGVYGSGLYAHVNDGHLYKHKTDNTPTGYKSSTAFANAMGYANNHEEGVMLLALEDDAKIITLPDLTEEVKKDAERLSGGVDKKKIEQLQKKEEQLKKDLNDTQYQINNMSKVIKDRVESDMGYDSTAIADMFTTIDNTTWNQRNVNGDLDFPKFDEMVKTNFVDWVKKNGGEAIEKHGQITFTLPHGNESFTVLKMQFNDDSAIRQRNIISPAYHIVAERFKNWFTVNHINIVQDKIQEELRTSGDKVKKLRKTSDELTKELEDIRKDIQSKTTPDPNANIYQAAIAYRGNRYAQAQGFGVIAAMKGYDAIYQPNGNDIGNGFLVILNRSKVIVKQNP